MPGQPQSMAALPFYLVALTMLMTGVCTMSLRDYMDVSHFHFPIHWVWLTQIGYLLCMPIHRLTKTSEQGRLPFVHQDAVAMPMTVYVICMILDAAAMSCAYIAMGTISAAVVQMMRGAKLLITFTVSITYLRKPQEKHHYTGVMMTLLGLMIVAAGSLQKGHGPNEVQSIAGEPAARAHAALEKGGDGNSIIAALALCLLSEVFMASSYLYQDHIVKKYDAPTLQIVGMMGVTGTIGFSVLLLALNLQGIESSPAALHKVWKSFPLALAVVVYTLALPIYELAGLTVSKHGSAVIRALVDVTRGALIWGVELFYQWVDFEILHLVGFCIITCGTLVYCGAVQIPGLTPDVVTAGESSKLTASKEFSIAKDFSCTLGLDSEVAGAANKRAPVRLPADDSK